MPSSGLLRSVEWLFHTEVSVQAIRPIFKSQAEFLTLEDGTDSLFRNAAAELNTLRCVSSPKSADLIYIAAFKPIILHVCFRLDLSTVCCRLFSSPPHCLTTGAQPLPQRVFQRVRCSTSSPESWLFLKVIQWLPFFPFLASLLSFLWHCVLKASFHARCDQSSQLSFVVL